VLYFATSSNKLLFQVLAPPHITSPEQLRGQSVGVGGRGSASDFAMRYALRRLGYDPEQDVLIRDVPGGEMQILAGLQSGSFLAGTVAPPTDYYGEQLGLRSLVRIGDWDARYQGTAPGTTRAFLTTQRDTVRRFLRGYVASVHRAKTDRAYALAVLRQYTQIEDERALEWGYRAYIEPLDPVPYATEDGMQLVIDSLVDVLPDVGKLQPAALIDNSLLRELESEGFVAALYRS
jgi:ABC-type nitrate/sulfonate/bicarbonate transport system substrate-binding protein